MSFTRSGIESGDAPTRSTVLVGDASRNFLEVLVESPKCTFYFSSIWVASFQPRILEHAKLRRSVKTDPVRFKWGFGEGLLKDKFAFF